MNALDFLKTWYQEQCNGDWEHEFGVRIETLDNPGWWLRIGLIDTDAEGQVLAGDHRELTEGRWIHSKSDGERYEATCDPLSLDDMLLGFREFVERGKAE